MKDNTYKTIAEVALWTYGTMVAVNVITYLGKALAAGIEKNYAETDDEIEELSQVYEKNLKEAVNPKNLYIPFRCGLEELCESGKLSFEEKPEFLKPKQEREYINIDLSKPAFKREIQYQERDVVSQ